MRKALTTLRDFSGGQLDPSAARADNRPEYQTGARIVANWLCEPAGSLVPRPGRRLLARTGAPRIEYARVGSTDFAICFVPGGIAIYALASAAPVAQNLGAYPWAAATVGQIAMTVCDNQIVICFPGMQPQLAVYAPATATWTFQPFTFRTIASQSQQPFYRSGNLGATIAWSGVTGSVTLTCSQPYFSASQIGNVISLLGQQVTITGVSDAEHATAQVADRLPDTLVLAVADCTPFAIGQLAELLSGAYKIEIIAVSAASGAGTVTGTLTSAITSTHGWGSGDVLVSPIGQSSVTRQDVSSNGGTEQWNEQFMGAALGWPQSCSFDRSRLIFNDFPQKPGAILWSAIGEYDVFWIDPGAATLQSEAGAAADSAILDFMPEGPRVRWIVGWGDEFVFTDKGIFLIPIQAAGNPLQPGSVEFRQFSNDGVAGIRPVKTQDAIVYVNAGGKRASVVIRTGSYTNPYTSDGAAEIYNALFTGPIALAVPAGDGQIPERLVYVLNADGSVVVGKFAADRKFVGWAPWTSINQPTWLMCSGPLVYYAVALAGSWWLEAEDNTLWLDDVVMANAPAASLPPPPGGDGPLTMFANGTVTVMDGALDHGDLEVDVNGNLVPDPNEDALTSPTIAVGTFMPLRLQPFVPDGAPGESVGQRQHRRKIARALVRTEIATGFTLGTREVSSYEQGDDQSEAPPLRSLVVQTRPIGRSYDPGCLLQKTRPGPLRVVEYSTEATI